MAGKVLDDMEVDDLTDDKVVPPGKSGLKRYPFVFLIDISGSTGDQPDPDIAHINTALSNILEMLRKPTPSSDLAKQIDHVDVCVVAYSDSVDEIIAWRTADKLPTGTPHLVPMGGTSTGKAVEYALNRIGDRLSWYRDKKLGFGMPHIIHMTDGAMNDYKPGDPGWNAIKSKLSQVDGRANSEKRIATMINFISPKGCDKDFVEIDGKRMSGIDLLTELTGKDSIYEMGKEHMSFERFVRLITVVITKITQTFGTRDALSEGTKASAGDVKPTKMMGAG